MTDFVWTDKVNDVDDVNAEDINAIAHEVERLEDDKVDKVEGKSLSTNDFTDNDKDKLDDIETGAEVNAIDDVQQNGESVVDENKVAKIDAYKKEDALSIMCPQTETTSTTISDAIEHDAIDYTIYGNTVDNQGVGNEVTIEGVAKYVIPVRNHGKNLLNITQIEPHEYSKQEVAFTLNNDKSISCSGSTISGATISWLGSFVGDGSKITLSGVPHRSAGGKYAISILAEKNIDNRYTFIQMCSDGSEQSSHQSPKTTENGRTYYVLLYVWNNTDMNGVVFKPQIEKGESATSYEPYRSETTNIYLDAPLETGDSISLSDSDMPPIKLYKGTNIIEFDTDVQPSSVNFRYYQDINKFSGGVSGVASVNGRTGAVTLAKSDVGLGNVENTSDANKPVSTAQQAAFDLKANASDMTAIQSKIPSQASSDNQLADKDFVNSSIATETAHYISNNGEPFTSVAQLEAYEGAVTNNDYAFITGTDGAGNTYYDKYKATVSGNFVSWAKEYRLNNSSFTAAQWAAISSGATSSLIAQITTNQNAIASINTEIGDIETALIALRGGSAS